MSVLVPAKHYGRNFRFGSKIMRYIFLPFKSVDLIQTLHWPSPPGTFHILIGKFSYFVIRFLFNSSIKKSDNKIG